MLSCCNISKLYLFQNKYDHSCVIYYVFVSKINLCFCSYSWLLDYHCVHCSIGRHLCITCFYLQLLKVAHVGICFLISIAWLVLNYLPCEKKQTFKVCMYLCIYYYCIILNSCFYQWIFVLIPKPSTVQIEC